MTTAHDSCITEEHAFLLSCSRCAVIPTKSSTLINRALRVEQPRRAGGGGVRRGHPCGDPERRRIFRGRGFVHVVGYNALIAGHRDGGRDDDKAGQAQHDDHVQVQRDDLRVHRQPSTGRADPGAQVQQLAGQVRADGHPVGAARNAAGGGDVRPGCQRRAVGVREGEVHGRGRGEAQDDPVQFEGHGKGKDASHRKETIDWFDVNPNAEREMYDAKEKTKGTPRSIITAAYGAQGSGGAPGEGPLNMGDFGLLFNFVIYSF